MPRDLAVAGYDDMPLARYLSLATASAHMTANGERAAARLIQALGGSGSTGVDELISPALIVRATTVSE